MSGGPDRVARRSALQGGLRELLGESERQGLRGITGAAARRVGGLPAAALPAGVPLLEELLGGWPRPGVSVISGLPGSGRLSVLLPAAAVQTRLGQPVAVVDPGALLHPPGLVGVELEHLLLVRPGAAGALWAVEQLVSSGLFPLVIALEAPRLDRAGPRLRRAALRGGTSLVLIARRQPERIPASLRLDIVGRSETLITLRVWSRRGGLGGREIRIPTQLSTLRMIR